MPFPAKRNFKEEIFKAIKEGKGDEALEMWAKHIRIHNFLESCDIFIHYTLPHRVTLFSMECFWKKTQQCFLYVSFDWLNYTLTSYTLPDEMINETISINGS